MAPYSATIHRTAVLPPRDTGSPVVSRENQVIHFHKVQKNVDGRRLFTDLTLFLPKTSYTLLCGGTQSGKTTLLQMIMAYEKPDQGALRVDGIDLGDIPASRIPFLRRQIGLIAHTPVLLEDRSIVENISVPLQLAGFDQDVIQKRLAATLAQTGLHDEQHIKVNRLTAPTRQLVSAARATIHKPAIILADEPLEDMDAGTANLLAGMLNEANVAGATVLIASQSDESYVQRLANNCKTLTLSEGSIKQNEFEQNNLG